MQLIQYFLQHCMTVEGDRFDLLMMTGFQALQNNNARAEGTGLICNLSTDRNKLLTLYQSETMNELYWLYRRRP
jgi:hypothetical protein